MAENGHSGVKRVTLVKSTAVDMTTDVNKNGRIKSPQQDNEESDEDSQCSSEQFDSESSRGAVATSGGRIKTGGASQEWVILEGLKAGQRFESQPEKYEGYMMKRRKWPLKGWHKRYFVLENGMLTYAKSPNDIMKGRFHDSVDVGLSVLTYKQHGRRIDIDTEELIYHLKVKTAQLLEVWLKRFRQHRLYRQHEITFGTKDVPKLTDVATPIDDFTPIASPVSPNVSFLERRQSMKHPMERSQSRVTAWLLDSSGIDQCNRVLLNAQEKIFELSGLLETLQQPTGYERKTSISLDFNTPYPNKKASKKALSKSAKKEKKSVYNQLLIPEVDRPVVHLSSSNPNLVSGETDCTQSTSSSTDALMTAGQDARLRHLKCHEEFVSQAKSVHERLRLLLRMMTTERDRFKHTMEQENSHSYPQNNAQVHQLKQALSEALKQNADYLLRLSRIQQESSIAGATTANLSQDRPYTSSLDKLTTHSEEPAQVTHSASIENNSIQEFFDAAEYLDVSAESSEASEDEDDAMSDTSDTGITSVEDSLANLGLQTGRRSVLPVSKPDTGDVGLFSLLYKNIGKDLSKISMPVTLNEPLNMLQRLCEELEYSELLDKAAQTDDPYERMVLVAAFSVSPYAATYYRPGQKPFNPVLGETYECIREDRGWRFIAEQVSHHPPVSGCYCECKNFIFWQDMQIKTKFWGKSMEIQPLGKANLKLPAYDDHYTWNKATTCIHNLLGGQRWVDHYGEVVIENHTLGIQCQLNYAKSSYWSDKRHEVYGSVLTPDGAVVHQLFGRWNEEIRYGPNPSSAKTAWRPGSMPENFEMYYGFTRFAIELNEIDEEQVHMYAPTDTRFRPDQRLLEEGKVQEAEASKLQTEKLQRDRRKEKDDSKHTPMWFVHDPATNSWLYTNKYWEMRKDPGFVNMNFPKLW